jgi:dTDP-4-dehydrorhamnose reductase
VRILITGAGGMLGSSMVPALANAGHLVYPTDLRAPSVPTDFDLRATSCTTSRRTDASARGSIAPMALLDVRRADHVSTWIERARPELVLHLAAETDVDLCESQTDHAYTTNALGTEIVAQACKRARLPLAYVSTAGVFDGTKSEAYTEEDPAIPINVYGASKLAGERYVQALLDDWFVVRAGWMVGGGDRDHKFVAKILHQLEDGATTIYAVDDKWGTPTYAPDFSRCFARLIEAGKYGLYHMACLGSGTRYDVARKILQVLGRDHDVRLQAVGSEFFQESYPAPRPRSEMMRNLHLDKLGLNTMRHWEESLDEYLVTAFAQLRCAGAMVKATRSEVPTLVESR